jgi:ATP/maltotriose-dependent transcriptional regulator MalT
MTARIRLPRAAAVLMLGGSLMLAASLALSGCSSQNNGYPTATAQALQAQVLAVSQGSADGDFSGSLSMLDDLDTSVQKALDRGTISQERYTSITAAIALVRGDLESAVAAEQQQQQQQQQPAPPTTPQPKPGKGDPGKGKKKP